MDKYEDAFNKILARVGNNIAIAESFIEDNEKAYRAVDVLTDTDKAIKLQSTILSERDYVSQAYVKKAELENQLAEYLQTREEGA